MTRRCTRRSRGPGAQGTRGRRGPLGSDAAEPRRVRRTVEWPAKELLASVYDQLGFRAEAGPWRDVYLTGAYELRHGIRGTGIEPARATGLLRNSPVERFLDSVAVRLTRELLIALGTEQAGLKDLVMSDDLTVEGSRLKLLSFLALIDTPDVRSPVVTP